MTEATPARLTLADFTAGMSPGTRATYGKSLRAFAAWRKLPEDEAARDFLAHGPGYASATACAWRSAMFEEGIKPATIRLRMAALGAMVRAFRGAGAVGWTLELPRGSTWSSSAQKLCPITTADYARMLEASDAMGRAALRLMGDRGLRVSEVWTLRVMDFDFEARSVAVAGKGRGGNRETLAIHPATARALRDWLAVRAAREADDRIFPFLSIRGAAELVYRAAKACGLRCSPHDLRRLACDRAYEASGGDVVAVQAFMRHGSIEMTRRYMTLRADAGGRLAVALPDAAPPP